MPVYKNETKNTYYTSFYYTDWTGAKKKKKKEGFKTKREAKEFERNFLETAQANPNMTFRALHELYMEDCKTRVKPTTYAGKVFMIDSKIMPYFKDMPIDEIEPTTVRKWQNSLISHENNYSQTYLKTVHNQLTAMFNFATKYYKLPSNPARICGSMGKKNADSMQFWTVDEFKQFIAYIDTPMYYVIYNMLFFTGMRIGECLALTYNDFDFSNNTVHINKTYTRLQGVDLIQDPKTPKSLRTISLSDNLCKIVQDYHARLPHYKPKDRLFPTVRCTMNGHLKRVCEKNELRKIRVHDLRHSHASLLIEMGFTPLLISERLGHDNIETTLNTYSHLYPNKHNEVSDRLNELI